MPTRGADQHARHRFTSSIDELVSRRPSAIHTLCQIRIAQGLPVVDPLASPRAGAVTRISCP